MTELERVVRDVHDQHGDDLCWMDIDRIFAAAGLSVPDRKVGDKVAMLTNCERFINVMCSGGKWRSYAEMERELEIARENVAQLQKRVKFLSK